MINLMSRMFLKTLCKMELKVNAFTKLLLIISLFLVSSCLDSTAPDIFAGNRTGITCLEADDFGYTKLTIDSQGKNVTGPNTGQYSEWTSVGTRYNGGNIAIFVYGPDFYSTSMWYPFLGDVNTVATMVADPATYPQCAEDSTTKTATISYDSNQHTYDLFTCNYCNPNNPQAPQITLSNVITYDGQKLATGVTRAYSCFMTYGAGAYLLTVPAASDWSYTDPNSSPATIKNPLKNISGSYIQNLHPTSAGGSLLQTNGISTGGFQGTLSSSSGSGKSAVSNTAKLGDPLFVKIMDYYYTDNVGAMQADIKIGDMNIGPIQKFIDYIFNKILQYAIQDFTNLVDNDKFKSMVRATLTLYFCLLGIMFSIGMVQFTHKELIKRVFRVLIISVLLTGSASWNFFNGYFLNMFTGGFLDLTSIVTSVFTQVNDKGDVRGSLVFFDQILDIFFCPETTSKIWSLLLYHYVGIYMIPLIYYAIYVFVKVIIETVMYYVMTYMTICFLISMAPMFFVFMLFDKTKYIFDAWINQLSSYVIQGVFYIAALGMMTVIILTEFYKVLGFRVCWVTVVTLIGAPILNFFSPCSPGSDSKCPDYLPGLAAPRQKEMLVPGWSFASNTDYTPGDTDNTPDVVYGPYTHTDIRNVDFPFLDPTNDATLLSQLSSGEFGEIAHIGEVLIFVLVTVLAMEFMKLVPKMAKAVSGTPNQQSDIQGASKQASSNMMSAAKATAGIAGRAAKYAGRVTGVNGLLRKAQDKLSNLDKSLSKTKGVGKFRKAGAYLYKTSKVLANSAKYLVYALGTGGKLHPKLKDSKGFKALKGGAIAGQTKLLGAANKVKGAFTPKFISDIKKGSEAFDKKWDRKKDALLSPLTKRYDAVMDKVERLEAMGSGRATLKPADLDSANLAKLMDDKDQGKGAALRNTVEGARAKEFLDSIKAHSQTCQDKGKPDKFKDCYDIVKDSNGKAITDQNGKPVLEMNYEKALKVYANDINADQSIVPASLKKFATITPPDSSNAVAKAQEYASAQKSYSDASATHLKAMEGLSSAMSSGDEKAIASAQKSVESSKDALKEAFDKSTKAFDESVLANKEVCKAQAKYEILQENHSGVKRDKAPTEPDRNAYVAAEAISASATSYASLAESKRLEAWGAFSQQHEANPGSPEAAKAWQGYVGAFNESVAAGGAAMYYRAEATKSASNQMVQEEKYNLLQESFDRKKFKQNDDF
jgi:type IV secretory pathway VirB6-like protein